MHIGLITKGHHPWPGRTTFERGVLVSNIHWPELGFGIVLGDLFSTSVIVWWLDSGEKAIYETDSIRAVVA